MGSGSVLKFYLTSTNPLCGTGFLPFIMNRIEVTRPDKKTGVMDLGG
jgi:hypothetical protein